MQRLLLVDDDEEILELLSRFFGNHGYMVDRARDGMGMFALLRKQSFDLIVLDVMLPGEDGLSVCRRVRAALQIPIIMLTAMGDHIDRVVGLELGADDYLAKPFNARELLARVKAVLRRSRGPREMEASPLTRPALFFANWRLDLLRRELRTLDNMMVALSEVEFDLLLTFAEHPRQVLTRDRLLDLAHGRGCAAFDRTIDVQVSRLRRKIDHDPEAQSLIQTVRNGGYLFLPAVQQG